MEDRLASISFGQIFQKQDSKVTLHLLNFSFIYRHELCILSLQKHQKGEGWLNTLLIL